jgi:hypothetical protein
MARDGYGRATERRPRGGRGLALSAAVAIALAAVNALALIHLSERWTAAAPERAARRAASAAAERAYQAEAASERRRDDLDGRNGEAAQRRALADLKRRSEALSAGARPAAAPAAPVSQPVVWRVEPTFQLRRSDIAPGFTDVAVRFNCRVTREGTLTACGAVETPHGSGLARATLPALDKARLEPIVVDGRAVESTISFGVSFRFAPPPPRPAAPVAAAPAPVPTEAVDAELPAPEAAEPSAAEPVPAG